MSATLYITGFHIKTRARDLALSLEQYGTLKDLELPVPKRPSNGGPLQPIAFAVYRDPRDAGYAIRKLDNTFIQGQRIYVTYARGKNNNRKMTSERDSAWSKRSPVRPEYRERSKSPVRREYREHSRSPVRQHYDPRRDGRRRDDGYHRRDERLRTVEHRPNYERPNEEDPPARRSASPSPQPRTRSIISTEPSIRSSLGIFVWLSSCYSWLTLAFDLTEACLRNLQIHIVRAVRPSA